MTSGNGQVLPHCQMRVERVVLEHHGQVAFGRPQPGDVTPVHRHAPAIRCFQPRDDAQQRALAAAGRADQRQELARPQPGRDTAQAPASCRTPSRSRRWQCRRPWRSTPPAPDRPRRGPRGCGDAPCRPAPPTPSRPHPRRSDAAMRRTGVRPAAPPAPRVPRRRRPRAPRHIERHRGRSRDADGGDPTPPGAGSGAPVAASSGCAGERRDGPVVERRLGRIGGEDRLVQEHGQAAVAQRVQRLSNHGGLRPG